MSDLVFQEVKGIKKVQWSRLQQITEFMEAL